MRLSFNSTFIVEIFSKLYIIVVIVVVRIVFVIVVVLVVVVAPLFVLIVVLVLGVGADWCGVSPPSCSHGAARAGNGQGGSERGSR